MNHKRMMLIIAVLVLLSLVLTGCSIGSVFHVQCYQTGVLIIDVQIKRTSLNYWTDTETGKKIILPDEGCIWHEVLGSR